LTRDARNRELRRRFCGPLGVYYPANIVIVHYIIIVYFKLNTSVGHNLLNVSTVVNFIYCLKRP